MESSLEEVTDAELHRAFIESYLNNEFHKVAIARVESYDVSSQTVELTLMVNRMLPDGATPPNYTSEPLPKIPSAKVMHPRAGGFFVAMPVKKGDFGVALFCDRGIATWRSTGNQSDPGDLGLNTLSSALFFPCVFPDKQSLQNADANNLVIGSDTNGSSRIVIKPGGEIDAGAAAAQFVAMANKAKTWLDAFVGAVTGWTPVSQDGGAALKAALTTANIIGPTKLSTDWSSTNLKAED